MPGLPGHQRLGLEADFIRTLVFVSRPGCAWPARTSLGLPYSSRLVCPEDTSPGPEHLPPPHLVQRGPRTRFPTIWTLPGPRLGPGANFLAHRGTTGAFSSSFWKGPSLHTGPHLSGPSATLWCRPLPPRHTHAERVRISWCRPGFALGFPAGTGCTEVGSWLHLCNLGLTLALESQTQFFICEMGLSAFLEGLLEETPLSRDQTLSFGRGARMQMCPGEPQAPCSGGGIPLWGPILHLSLSLAARTPLPPALSGPLGHTIWVV